MSSEKKPRARKPKPPSKDQRYAQIKKLIKKCKPITINGIPVATIVKQAQKQDHEAQAPEPAAAAKVDHVDEFVANFMKNQPKQAIYVSFILYPSDPDFPFDLDNLKLSLCVPHDYPSKKSAKPTIYVLNDEIPRGYAVNIELGFKRIAELAVSGKKDDEIDLVDGKGLLSQIKTLNKYLEVFLRQEKRQTIKIIKAKPQSGASAVASSSTSARPSPSPAPVHVSRDKLNEKEKLVQEMVSKLGNYVKLFNKTDQEERYKIQLPINASALAECDLPALWLSNGKIELLLSITNNLEFAVSFPKNFAKTLLKKYTDPKEHADAVHQKYREILAFERNLVNNFNQYNFGKNSLVFVLNYLSNNLNYFCLDHDDFASYNGVVQQFQQTYLVY